MPHTAPHYNFHRQKSVSLRLIREFRVLLTTTAIILLSACQSSVDISDIPYVPKVVVEGRIENGGYPSVLLSISAPVTGVQDTVSLLQHAIRSARVIVSDDETADTLYLTYNSNCLPPYEYRGRNLQGQVGKNYSLKVEYAGDTITAHTYIPAPVEIKDIWFKRNQPTDTTGCIGISFFNSSSDFYQLATAPYAVRDIFTPCLYGNIDSNRYPKDELISIELNKGPSIYPQNDFSTVYKLSDTIRIKLSTQPQAAYDFWNCFQDEVLNGQNPIFPAYTSLQSNVNGGIGIWSGYGSTQRTVILRTLPER